MNLRRFLPALLVATTLAGLATTAQAGPVPRIIGGNDATNGEYPFMAALVRPATAGPLYVSDYQAQFCGGTVVGTRWVLTAAHCVDGITASDVQVITGVTTLADEAPFATRTDVAAILPHPLYDDDKISNDIALIFLATPVAASATLSMDDGSGLAGLVSGSDLTAIGWGITNQNDVNDPTDDSFLQTLQETVLDFVPFTTCDSSYYGGNLHDSAVCAGFLSGPPRDSCFGDSGGPLLQAIGGGNWRQIGITSYGASGQCAKADEPGVYVSVGRYNGFVTGAQTQPDLRVNLSTIAGSNIGIHVRTRLLVSNASPVTAAPNTTLTLTFNGDFGIPGIDALTGCTNTVTGVTSNKVTTITCSPGTLAASSSDVRELDLELYGPGPWSASATASSSAGDYYPQNNSSLRQYRLGAVQVNGAEESGGALPAGLMLLATLLVLRRRHAPHHSLRLRQLLRLG